MEQLEYYFITIVQTGGLFAPLLFIGFHLLRPLFFLPVAFICVSGGVLFGSIAGTIYSLIGITLSSIIFYVTIHHTPKTLERLIRLRNKILRYPELTISQIAFLRLIPFIHFHLLSLYLLEISSNFKDYTKASLLSNIPLAFIYTFIGKSLSRLSPLYMFLCLMIILLVIYLLRRKEMVIKWQDFFQTAG